MMAVNGYIKIVDVKYVSKHKFFSIMAKGKVIMCIFLFLGLFTSFAQKQDDEMNSKWKLLINTSDLPSNEGHLLVIPNFGLCYNDNGTVFPLDSVKCKKISKFRFLDNFSFDQLIVNDGAFLVKCQQFVLQIDSDNTKILTELNTDNFYIYSGQNGKYNLVVQEDSIRWAWYRCDTKSSTIECVLRAQEPILKILDREGVSLCIIGRCLYMETAKQLTLLSEAEEPLLDMTLTDLGCMLCTPRTLYIVDAEMQANIIAKGKFHSLYYDNGTLYVVLQNGDIMKTEI